MRCARGRSWSPRARATAGPTISNLATFEGAGVSYWASPVEAKLCEGEEVALVGGGNSAGQAVVFLAPKVKRLHLSCAARASKPRCRAISSTASPRCPMSSCTPAPRSSALEGDAATGLTGAVFRDRATGATHSCSLRHLFLFIGADPNAAWLERLRGGGRQRLRGDRSDCTQARARPAGCLPLETSQPGVFAIGDVRAGSTKRVAAAVGEGAAVVAQIHSVLAAEP